MLASHLIFVKHAAPRIEPGKPAAEWRLSADGRARCGPMAARLAAVGVDRVVTSVEPKAVETGQLLAEHLRCPVETRPDLHEHERRSAPFFEDVVAFRRAVADSLRRPAEIVLGEESIDAAHARFAAAVAELRAEFPRDRLVVVAHGTVIANFLAHANDCDPIPLWTRLGLPSFVVTSLPDYRPLEVVDTVDWPWPGR